MNREQKAAVVEELSQQIRSAEAIFAVDYRGISVSDAAELRNRLRAAQTSFRVVKNSLTERASDQAGTESLKAMLEGPTALAFVSGDAAVAAKALSDAARAFGTLGFKGGLMDGDALSAEQVQSIARLPARDVLHGQLVGTIAAPLSQLVRTLNALISGVAIQLQQVAEQGLVGQDAGLGSEAAVPKSDTEPQAEAARAASDPRPAPSSAEGEEAEATRAASEPEPAPSSAEGEEAEAAEAPAETAEEPAPEQAAEEPAPDAQDGPVEPAPDAEPPRPETAEQTETEPASDAEASEE